MHAALTFLQYFMRDLQDYFLGRLLNKSSDGGVPHYSDKERNRLSILGDRIYTHKFLRVNYTTYDMRRAQDSINPHTHPDIMVLSHEDKALNRHPYWYARVLSIFHADVRLNNGDGTATPSQRLEGLWVRWYGLNSEHRGGWDTRRLHRVGFVEHDPVEEGTFGFIDPSVVIRGVHLIPAFAHGKTSDLLGPSKIARLGPKEGDEDWRYYYVNI